MCPGEPFTASGGNLGRARRIPANHVKCFGCNCEAERWRVGETMAGVNRIFNPLLHLGEQENGGAKVCVLPSQYPVGLFTSGLTPTGGK